MGTSLKYFCYVFLLFSSCASKMESGNFRLEKKYKLLNIDSVSYKYNNILYFEKDLSIYIVVTKKESLIKCNKLVEGEVYYLRIKSVLPSNYPNFRDIDSQYMYNEEVIYFLKAENIKWGFYKTENIKGLCYINS